MPQAPQVITDLSSHRSSRGGAKIVAIVIHSTAGKDSRGWLKKNPRGVSAHVLIRKDGTVIRLVPDNEAAHHAGFARLIVRGRAIDRTTTPDPNRVTLGLELENLNDGRDPYPEAQLEALGWQLAEWVTRHPAARLVLHREIDTQGKTDPAGLTWPDIYRAMAAWLAPHQPALPPAPPEGITADSTILGQDDVSDEALIDAFARRCKAAGSPYAAEPEDPIRTIIGPAYARECRASGVRLSVALGQCGHESGWLTSALSQRADRDGRPLRNPAGIGVNGSSSTAPQLGMAWDADRQIYRACSQFTDWERESVPAHVGRLVAYATDPLTRTFAQAQLVARALAFRPLSIGCQGSAPTLRELGIGPNKVPGCGWAGAKETEGHEYGDRVAAAARALVALAKGD